MRAIPLLDRSNVLVVVPAYNEEASVAKVLNRLQELRYQILVISDGSKDATAQIARTTGTRVLELPINLGVGGALRAGFKFADRRNYQAVVQIDADGQHPAEEIENLIGAANETYAHLVIGSRFADSAGKMRVSRLREIVMKLLARTASLACDEKISDSTSGFRLIRQPLLGEFSQNFANNYLGDTYEALIAAGRSGYQVTEIAAGILPRENGRSTASSSDAMLFTLKGLGVWLLRFHIRITPHRVANSQTEFSRNYKTKPH